MTGHRWGPRPRDKDLIQRHLDRQKDLPPDRVRLDSGEVVPVGHDAEGEADECER